MQPLSAGRLDANATPAMVRAYFHVTVDADPGTLPRLIEPLSKLGLVPTRLYATRESGDGSQLVIDLRVAALEPRQADRVTGTLRAVVGVHKVIAVLEPH